MSRPRKPYRIKRDHWNGRHFYDLLLDGKKFRLTATSQEAAEAEGAVRYKQIVLERDARRADQAEPGPRQPALKLDQSTLREATACWPTGFTAPRREMLFYASSAPAATRLKPPTAVSSPSTSFSGGC